MTKKKFYVVWQGREPGIYESWDECKQQVHGFGIAKFKSFATKSEAIEAYNSSYQKNTKNQELTAKNLIETKKHFNVFNTESISVDAACSGNPGIMEYRGVYTKTHKEIFRKGPFNNGTNNIGEFLALVHALALLKQKNSDLPIYSDSLTAIAWVKKKKANTKLVKNNDNAVLFDLLTRAETWLQENEYTTKILKWETEKWGEIPADFGRK